MKKKLLALLVLVVVSVTMIFTATACSTGIFSKDEERDYYQVIGSVQYKYGDAKGDVISKDIYKGQLNSYVLTYGGTYQQNYGMSVESIVEYFYNNLTRNALVTLYAKSKIYELAAAGDDAFAFIDTSIALKNADPESLLTLGQRLYAVDEANKDFETSYKSYLDKKTSKDEDKEEDEEEEDVLDPRAVRDYSLTAASKYETTSKATSVAVIYGAQYKDITYGEITKSFIEETLNTTVEEFFNKMTFASQVNAKIAAEKDKTVKANMKDALKDLQDSIKDSYVNWEYFYDIEFDSQILASYQAYVEDNGVAEASKVEAAYATKKNADIKSYMDKTAYAKALTDSTFTLVHPSNEYVGVKSILLSFNDEQTAAIKALKTIYSGNDEYAAEIRDAIAVGFSDGDIMPAFLKEENIGVKVNVSNPLYNADEDKVSAAYTDKDLSYGLVLANMADSIAAIKAEIIDKFVNSQAYQDLDTDARNKAFAIVEEKASIEAFTQWMYLINDDPGMFSSERYVITPDGEATTYVPEFTVLGRELAACGVGAATVADKGSVIESYDEEYTGTTACFESKMFDLYMKSNVTSTVADGEEISARIFTIVTDAGNELSFIVNDYGIHVIMVTNVFGTDIFGGIDTQVIDGETAYVANGDALYSVDFNAAYDYTYTVADTFVEDETYFEFAAGSFVKVELTADTFEANKYYTRVWELQDVTCEFKTVKDYFEDQVKGYVYSDTMSVEQIVLYFDAEEGADPKIVKNEKVYDKYIKDLLG